MSLLCRATRRFDDLCSATFTMLFNVAHFSSLLLVPAVLAVPSALEASIARLRERRLSQPGNRFVGAASHTTSVNYAGAVVTEDAVRSIFHGLFCNRYRSHPHSFYNRELYPGSPGRSPPYCIGFDRGFCHHLG